MFYRRKIILGIIESFGEVNKTNLQKLLFLLTRNQTKKSFDFVPYKYGCYSFQANNDLRILLNQKLIKQEINEESKANIIEFNAAESYFDMLKKDDRENILRLQKSFGDFTQNELIKFTYINYPYFAINSKILNRLLSEEEIIKIETQKRIFDEKFLFTIGYEGISLEKYINKLIVNGVNILCDVRKNSFSMKYGFSKKQLQNACESVHIKFIHISNLGIVSEKRKELKTLKDYKILFEEYEKTVLKENEDSLKEIESLFTKNNRIALTCFEKEVCMCHRGKVAEALKNLPNWEIPIKHLT